MKRDILLFTRIFAVISIIALAFLFPACAEDVIVDNAVDIPSVETAINDIEAEIVSEESTDDVISLFTGILPFDLETVVIIAESGAVHEVNAASPLGRLALAALEGDGFDYVVNDDLFESDGILTLVSIGSYVNGEAGIWEAYDDVHEAEKRISNDELSSTFVEGDVLFVYLNENGELIAVVEIFAEALIDEAAAVDLVEVENEAIPEPTLTEEPIIDP